MAQNGGPRQNHTNFATFVLNCNNMIKRVFFIIILITGLFQLRAQNFEELLKNSTEVYFTFQASDRQELDHLTRMVSIDHVSTDLQVFAYANELEFKEFIALNISYRILPRPGTLIEPEMRDTVNVREITDWNFYPTFDAYTDMMYQFAEDHPDLCEVFSIGNSYQGRPLLVARISDNVGVAEGEPEFFYTSTMHGDETTGYVLMLRLIDYLLTEYNNDPKVTMLVNELDIYINPLANPDGTYKAGNSNIYGAIRNNAHNVDLNRNFPDPEDGPHPDGNEWQIETIHFMNFAEAHHFVMSANIHGGAEVCNYPWDTWAMLAADDNWWINVCREYADTAHSYSPAGYMTGFNNGITNGYQWYTISGGRQDYMNYFQQCREFTLEISNTKLLPANQLPAWWEYNYRSFLNYMEQALYGVRGRITDKTTGQPLEAEVYVLNHEADSSWVYSSLPEGNYHRMLAAGTYNIRYSKPGYHPRVFENVVVINREATVIDVELLDAFSSVDEIDERIVKIYPNPVTSSFMKVSSGYPVDSYTIWNMQGEVLMHTETKGEAIIFVDVSTLPPGTYAISLLHEGRLKKGKFVRQ
jgi:hypothetical protein